MKQNRSKKNSEKEGGKLEGNGKHQKPTGRGVAFIHNPGTGVCCVGFSCLWFNGKCRMCPNGWGLKLIQLRGSILGKKIMTKLNTRV
jgi:hypothetical protein